ncbi:hypothetical protein CASFOL_006004 [Castilleja foliolosa]|uniref:Uncharacterized protein n=1 Tax=Castilleja foliolosa TaxID=1961234 RepID=A0ABD3E942_9LAMI
MSIGTVTLGGESTSVIHKVFLTRLIPSLVGDLLVLLNAITITDAIFSSPSPPQDTDSPHSTG